MLSISSQILIGSASIHVEILVVISLVQKLRYKQKCEGQLAVMVAEQWYGIKKFIILKTYFILLIVSNGQVFIRSVK
jgi:hypothetical protein